MLIDISENVSPILTATGFVDVYFGKFEKIKTALVSFDQSMNLDGSGQLCMSYNYNPIDGGSLNYVRVYLTHVDASFNSGNRRAATTAMLNNKKVVVLATGETSR